MTSTAHISLRFIVTSFVCPIVAADGADAIRSGADPNTDNYSAA